MTDRPNANEMAIFCADIGSISQGNFAWARHSEDGDVGGSEIGDLADAVAACLNEGRKVALGFEAPLFVPLPDEAANLGKAREGESKAWSAGAGAQVLATALAQVSWLLARVRKSAPQDAKAFLEWKAFSASSAGLFLWEALVTGKAKVGTHRGDALIAIGAFQRALPDPAAHSLVRADRVLSLAGAALLRTGWSTDITVLSSPCVVLGAQ